MPALPVVCNCLFQCHSCSQYMATQLHLSRRLTHSLSALHDLNTIYQCTLYTSYITIPRIVAGALSTEGSYCNLAVQAKCNRSCSTASQLLQGLLSSSRLPIQRSFSSQSLPKLRHNRAPICTKQPPLRMCLLYLLPAKSLQAICRIQTSC